MQDLLLSLLTTDIIILSLHSHSDYIINIYDNSL